MIDDLMIHVGSADGARLLVPLARACGRAGIAWTCFLTHDGVAALGDSATVAALVPARRTVACEASWHRHGDGSPCPVELGSQTVNSALMAEARRVVSL